MVDRRAVAENRLARHMLQRYPDETARLLEGASTTESAAMLESLPVHDAVEVLKRLTPETVARLVVALSPPFAASVLEALDPQWAATLLNRLDEDHRDRLLRTLDEGTAAELRELSSYPPNSAGALMDPRVLALHPETTVAQTLSKLRGFRNKRVRRVFVIDSSRRMLGSVRLQDIAMAPPSQRLEGIMDPRVVALAETATREEVLDVLTRSKLPSLPVVDFDGRIVGVIRDDVLLEAAREEASADIQSMVGASRDERALSPVRFAVRKRLPWLEVNLGTAFLAASVVGLFESTIARYTALAVLLPVVAGQSGNTGAQALAVTMRGLALREVRVHHWLRVAIKETRVAFINGIAVAVTTALAVFVWSRSLGLTLVIFLSMIISMVAAGLSGAGIPMLLTAMKQDPAQSSSIILTTVTDVVGFFSFLGIATVLSGLL
jgi:magnesium transporter